MRIAALGEVVHVSNGPWSEDVKTIRVCMLNVHVSIIRRETRFHGHQRVVLYRTPRGLIATALR